MTRRIRMQNFIMEVVVGFETGPNCNLLWIGITEAGLQDAKD